MSYRRSYPKVRAVSSVHTLSSRTTEDAEYILVRTLRNEHRTAFRRSVDREDGAPGEADPAALPTDHRRSQVVCQAPRLVIEAKLTEDDGTARDKVTRVQHLSTLSMWGQPPGGPPKYEVVACIAGRGFGVRREDMKKLLLATRGKVFTLRNMGQLVEHTRLAVLRSR